MSRTKSMLVTGASRGIGAATAQYFLEREWRVGLIARDQHALDAMANAYPNAVPLPADVTDEAAVEVAFSSFCADRRLDVLFNNAGMFGPQTTIDQVTLDDWSAVVSVNMTGMFLCARAAFRRMKAQTPRGGRIINNGSISAYTPRERSTCYTVTKHGVLGLTKTLNLDGRDLGIACGQIDIGNAQTELVNDLQEQRKASNLEPLPTMDVKDVARSVWHMANLPEDTNVLSITVMANAMPYVGRG